MAIVVGGIGECCLNDVKCVFMRNEANDGKGLSHLYYIYRFGVSATYPGGVKDSEY